MDLRVLRYFATILEHGSISRAAEHLRIAQPALSVQVKALEAELGSQLLHRTSKGIRPTEAGARLLSHARDILQAVDRAREDLQREAETPIGTVSVGMPQSVAMVLTVPLVQEALQRLPRVSLRIKDSNTGYIPALLRDGTLDLGIIFREGDIAGLRCQRLVQEELMLLSPPALSPGQDTSPFRFNRIGHLPLVLPGRPHSLRELLTDYATRAKVNLKIVAEIDAIPQILDLVAGGLGHTILSFVPARDHITSGRVLGRRLISPAVHRSVFLCRLSERPPTRAVRGVEALLQELVIRLVRNGTWPASLDPQGHPQP